MFSPPPRIMPSNKELILIKRAPIVQESVRQDKVLEVQPILHREVDKNIVHHIEKHTVERAPSQSGVIERQPIIEQNLHTNVVNGTIRSSPSLLNTSVYSIYAILMTSQKFNPSSIVSASFLLSRRLNSTSPRRSPKPQCTPTRLSTRKHL